MKLTLPKLTKQHARFGAVGVINTLVDFGLYSVLGYVIGLPAFVANLISTSAGFMVSFFLNRRYTFDSKNQRKLHEFGRFFVTTFIGLWLIQPAIIYYVRGLLLLGHFSGIWLVVVPKAAAIAVALVWNYIWYSRFVFVKRPPDLRQVARQFCSSAGRWLRSDFGIMLAVAVLWQLGFTLIGDIIQYVLAPVFTNPNHWSIALSQAGPLAHTNIWDGGWYGTVAHDFYRHNAASAAFYPLFPLSVRMVQTLLLNGVSFEASAFLFNAVCLWLGLTALTKIARIFFPEQRPAQAWVVALFLAFPSAFFMHQLYSEAVFVALSFWAYYLALKRQWLASSVCLALLTATRVTSILVVGLVLLEFWRAHQWRVWQALRDKSILSFLLAPLGFLAYGLYLKVVRGDFLGMFDAYKATTDWIYQKFNPRIWHVFASSFYHSVHCVHHHFIGCSMTGDFVNTLLPFGLLMAMIALSVLATAWLRGAYIPLGTMGLATAVMLTLNNNLVSVHRYLLPVFTIYLVIVGGLCKLRWPLWLLFPLVQVGIALQTLLLFLFINVYFAG